MASEVAFTSPTASPASFTTYLAFSSFQVPPCFYDLAMAEVKRRREREKEERRRRRGGHVRRERARGEVQEKEQEEDTEGGWDEGDIHGDQGHEELPGDQEGFQGGDWNDDNPHLGGEVDSTASDVLLTLIPRLGQLSSRTWPLTWLRWKRPTRTWWPGGSPTSFSRLRR